MNSLFLCTLARKNMMVFENFTLARFQKYFKLEGIFNWVKSYCNKMVSIEFSFQNIVKNKLKKIDFSYEDL